MHAMKILTLRQPWATLWVGGAKMIETRSWSTNEPCEIAVHASKTFTDDERHLCFVEPFKSALATLGFPGPGLVPRGAILGIVNLVACLRMVSTPALDHLGMTDIHIDRDPRITEVERAFGHYATGRWAWIAGENNRFVLADPLPYLGARGLRVLPSDIADQLRAARRGGAEVVEPGNSFNAHRRADA